MATTAAAAGLLQGIMSQSENEEEEGKEGIFVRRTGTP